MRIRVTLAAFATLALGLALAAAQDRRSAGQTGSVEGRVLFDGGKPPKGVLYQDVVVYLVGDGLRAKSSAPSDNNVASVDTDGTAKISSGVVLTQKDLTFVPHVLPVLAGTPVEIKNADKVLHNIHTASTSNPNTNVAQGGETSMHVTFARPEIIHVGCDIHSQMSAWIVVLDNPFFTKPGKDGRFSIANVPPGKYKLRVWHEKYGRLITDVEVVAGKTTELAPSFAGRGK